MRGNNINEQRKIHQSSNLKTKRLRKQIDKADRQQQKETLKAQKEIEEIDDLNFQRKHISDKEFKNTQSENLDLKTISVLEQITHNYQLTYRQIQNKQEIYDLPRQKRNRIKCTKENSQNEKTYFQPLNELKHNYEMDQDIAEHDFSRDPINEQSQDNNNLPIYFTLANELINNFSQYEESTKNFIRKSLASTIQLNSDLLQSAITSQVKSSLDTFLSLYEQRNFKRLLQLLPSISPMAVCLINIEIAKQTPQFQLRAGLLRETLLPYLMKCQNYSFISIKYKSICSNFVSSLCQYYQDQEEVIDINFVKFALEFNPQALKIVINTEQNTNIISQGLRQIGFPEQACSIIKNKPKNILWNQLIKVLQLIPHNELSELLQILTKLIILNEPEPYIDQLRALLQHRRLFTIELLKLEEISLTIDILIQILENIKNKAPIMIKELLAKDPKVWHQQSLESDYKEQIIQDKVSEEDVNKFYETYLEGQHDISKVQLCSLQQMSQATQNSCQNYVHSPYQSAVAAIAVSQQSKVVIVEMPTASGKTWIQGLIASYYIDSGEKVTLIEPNNLLRTQTQEMIGKIHYDLSILTIDEFYSFPRNDTVIIINEYDYVVKEFSFSVKCNKLQGLWNLQNRKIFLFSATSHQIIERIIYKLIEKPKILKFHSEFEFKNNSMSAQQGEIKIYDSKEDLYFQIERDIEVYYDKKPIILFIGKESSIYIFNLLKRRGWDQYKYGADLAVLSEIKNWSLGILILHKDQGIGINTRFQKDSIVLIADRLENESEYTQLIGRSSRVKGLCQSIYYSNRGATPSEIIQDMKSEALSQYQALEQLLLVIYYKRNNAMLIESVELAIQNNDQIRNLKDLQQIIGPKNFSKLVRCLQI